jgi:hypothetical protein
VCGSASSRRRHAWSGAADAFQLVFYFFIIIFQFVGLF